MKKLFYNEINKIKNEKLKKAAEKMADDLPEYFWSIPASSSGKYHPKCDLGEGGLVRHSIMVCHCAIDLVVCEMFVVDIQANRDIARVAALFHDSFKCGYVAEDGSYSDHTEFEHPRFAANFIREHLVDAKIDKLTTSIICDAVYTHMGKWCKDKYGNVKALPKPRTDFERLIHLADYIASRKYIAGLDEWQIPSVYEDDNK